MAAGWVVFVLLTGALVAAMAFALEGLARSHRLPTRWSWGAGLAALVLLGARAAWVARAPVSDASALLARVATPAGAIVAPVRASLSLATLADAISGVLVRMARLVPAGAAHGVAIAWLGASLVVLGVFLLVHARLGRVRRAWPRADLQGRRVRIAPAQGPAVLGLVRPDIVVPRWLLSRSAEEQRLVLAHEAEHVRAGDHLLLAAAWLVVAAFPWHPAVWWMLARLRLAIELDCDARVLRRGVAPRAYGTLLVDLAGQCTGFRVGATALADESSHLQRRLLAMTTNPSRFTHLRAGATVAVVLLATLAACEAKLPTSAEVQKADVAAVEAKMQGADFKVAGADYFIDGKPATEAEAHAIPSTRIASVNVTKINDGHSRIEITTGEGSANGIPVEMHMKHAGSAADIERMHAQHDAEMARSFTGVLIVDGVQVDNSVMARLSPSEIVSVDVIKGPAALQASSDPKAANGVIRIVTKAGAKK